MSNVGLSRRERFKRPLRAVRGWPPLNVPVTSAVRATLALARWQPTWMGRLLPRTGVVEAALPGGEVLRMWSRGDDNVATMLFWRGWDGHEAEVAPHFYRYARSARVTLDIGAHVGYFALVAGHANRAGEVHAFEPLTHVYQRLVHNVALNDLGNVFCHEVALGSRTERKDFYYVNHGIPSSSGLSLAVLETMGGGDELVSSEVDVGTVDEFVDANGLVGVDLVKIDTEGTEADVLAGMVRTLARDRPTIICEVLPQGPGDALQEILVRHEYRWWLLTDAGPQRRERVVADERWHNFLFRPAERT